MNNQKEIQAINIQLIALTASLISSIISIVITYHQKLELENKKTYFSAKEIYNLTLLNRILILILAIIFLYINYILYKISSQEGEDLKSYKLQIYASILTVISGAIALYVVSLSSTDNISDIENPII